jgi:tRNA-splicing endonuclease subunit Sen34
MMPEVLVTEPFPIPCIAGRYLLFDIEVVTYLRRAHNICGVLIGSIPQVPQQNIFLGLPVELLPEEARLLVEKNVAYIVDDLAFHKTKLSSLDSSDRKAYLESLRSEGLKARKVAESRNAQSAERGLAKQAAKRAAREKVIAPGDEESVLFETRSASPAPSTASSTTSISTPAITLTTSYPPLSSPVKEPLQSLPPVPASYPLFAYLHQRGYFMTPGLRFGCQYSVYPGDPLRFHSHFLAVGLGWQDEIPLLDIVGGGRLGTGVKKGFVLGGEDPSSESKGVRAFSIEWGGM